MTTVPRKYLVESEVDINASEEPKSKLKLGPVTFSYWMFLQARNELQERKCVDFLKPRQSRDTAVK